MSLGDEDFGGCDLGDGANGDPITNLGFEQGGAGFAFRWQIRNVTARGVFAAFGLRAREDFERGWGNTPYFFALTNAIAAPLSASVYIAPKSFDDFERGWQNFPFLTTSFPAIAAVFTGPQNANNFEQGWDNDSYAFAWPGGTAAVFDGNGFENFEQSWGNTTYDFTWPGGTDFVISGQLAKTVEDFEDVKEPQLYTVDFMLEQLITIGHGLGADYGVIFDIPVAGLMPTPIAPGVRYYVQNVVDPDKFQIALLPAAAGPIDIATNGSGLLRWSAPWEFWVTKLVAV